MGGAPVDGEAAGDLFHITSVTAWQDAQWRGELAPTSLQTQGFVHLSARGQVAGTLRRFFAGQGGLLLLRIDPSAMPGPLRWEEGEPGELFPHHYAPVPLVAVSETWELRRGRDGEVELPWGQTAPS